MTRTLKVYNTFTVRAVQGFQKVNSHRQLQLQDEKLISIDEIVSSVLFNLEGLVI